MSNNRSYDIPVPATIPFPGQDRFGSKIKTSSRNSHIPRCPNRVQPMELNTLFAEIKDAYPTPTSFEQRNFGKPLKVLVCGRYGKSTFIKHFVPDKLANSSTPWPEFSENNYFQFIEVPFGDMWDPVLCGYAGLCDVAVVALQGACYKPEHLQKYINILYSRIPIAVLFLSKDFPPDAIELCHRYNIRAFLSRGPQQYLEIEDFLVHTVEVGRPPFGETIQLKVLILAFSTQKISQFLINLIGQNYDEYGNSLLETEFCKTKFSITFSRIFPNSEYDLTRKVQDFHPDSFLICDEYDQNKLNYDQIQIHLMLLSKYELPKIIVYANCPHEQNILYSYNSGDGFIPTFFFSNSMAFPPVRFVTWFLLYPYVTPIITDAIPMINVSVIGPSNEDAQNLVDLLINDGAVYPQNFDFSPNFPAHAKTINFQDKWLQYNIIDFSSTNKISRIKSSQLFHLSIFCCSAFDHKQLQNLPDLLNQVKLFSNYYLIILYHTDHPAADIDENDIREAIKDFKYFQNTYIMSLNLNDPTISENFLKQIYFMVHPNAKLAKQ